MAGLPAISALSTRTALHIDISPKSTAAAPNPQMNDAMQSTRAAATPEAPGMAGFDPIRKLQTTRTELQNLLAVPVNGQEKGMSERMGQMLKLQGDMYDAQFQVELASKVVEEATGGAKTLLQSQS